ncbi:hypothetical protein ACFQX6_27630 [Streptosporangium lutulentum]
MSEALWIVDIDGTLALRGDRGPYDWDRVGEDLPNHPVVTIVKALILAAIRSRTCRAGSSEPGVAPNAGCEPTSGTSTPRRGCG